MSDDDEHILVPADYDYSNRRDRLKNLMEERKLSQADVAKICDLPPQYINRILLGKMDISVSIAEKLSDGLCVGKEWILYGLLDYKEYPINGRILSILQGNINLRKQIYEMTGEDKKSN